MKQQQQQQTETETKCQQLHQLTAPYATTHLRKSATRFHVRTVPTVRVRDVSRRSWCRADPWNHTV